MASTVSGLGKILCRGHDVAEALHGGLAKLALVGVEAEAGGVQPGEDGAHGGDVAGEIRRRDEDIIDIDVDAIEAAEDLRGQALECLCRIAEAKWHDRPLVEAPGRDDGREGPAVVGHGDLVERFLEVEP